MDLAKLDVRAAADDGASLHLRSPFTNEPLTGEDGKAVTIRVLGRDSARVEEKRQEIERRKAKGEQITEKEQGIELLAVVMAGWSDNLGFDGEPLPFSFKNAVRLLSDPRTEWIGEQVAPFSLARRNFVGNVRKG